MPRLADLGEAHRWRVGGPRKALRTPPHPDHTERQILIDIDLGSALRSPSELVALASAVISAKPGDESHFLEWKSTLDLESSAGQYAIARTVIGMFNRSVELASSAFEGVGYILVGVEPGTAAGVDIPDSAKVTAGIAKYLAGPQIRWYHLSVSLEDVTVLVVVVESPKPGDRIASLAKTFQPEKGKGADAGTIFVRTSGQTLPATSADIQSLENRLLESMRAPSLRAASGLTIPSFGLTMLEDDPAGVQAWIEQKQNGLLLSEQVRVHPAFQQDGRTPEQFRDDVERYGRDLSAQAPQKARSRLYSLYKNDAWALTVDNEEPEALRDVELSLLLPPGFEIHTTDPRYKEVRAPRPFNSGVSAVDIAFAGLPQALDVPRFSPTSLSVDKQNGGWSVTASFKLIQAHKRETSDPFVIIGLSSKVDRALGFMATATIRAANRRGKVDTVVSIASERVRSVSILQLVDRFE